MSSLLKPILKKKAEAAAESQKTIWNVDSDYFIMTTLQVDKRGQVGEEFVVEVLKELGHEVIHTSRTDPANKQWDLVVDDKYRWEVKTATVGRNGGSFQHENIYKERDYHGIIFLDIAPDALYVSFVVKHEINWNALHRRKDSVFYKWDFTRSKILGREVESVSIFGREYNNAIAKIDVHLERKGNPHKI